ncbi:hypothetical protein ACWGE0_39660 [Lentzea sp. NPDC054927]
MIGLLAVAVLVAGWWVVTDRPAEEPVAFSGTCIAFAGPEGDAQCQRAAVDLARRRPVTDDDKVDAAAVEDDLDTIVMRLGQCLTPNGQAPCGGTRTPPRPATDADARLLAERLSAKGMRVGVTRLAGPDDPAPPGSLFYAVALPGGGCVVGHLTQVPGGLGGRSVVGPLPDGRCAGS